MAIQVRIMQPETGIGGSGDIDPFRVMSGDLYTTDPTSGSILFSALSGEVAYAERIELGIGTGGLNTSLGTASSSVVSGLRYAEIPFVLASYQNPVGDSRLWYPGGRGGGAHPGQRAQQYRFETTIRRLNSESPAFMVMDFTLGTSSNQDTIRGGGVLTVIFIGYPV